MNKYRIELATPAVRAYQSICDAARNKLAAGEDRSPRVDLLRSVDDIIDNVIPFSPFQSGAELCGGLSGVYWISRGRLHVFYEASKKPLTIAILCIWDGPTNEVHMRNADAICTEMLLSGKYYVLPPDSKVRRAAAN